MASKELKKKIDKKLSKIGMSMKNKGLISYLDKGIEKDGTIKRIYEAAIDHPDIRKEFALAYAITSTNRYLNGGQISGLREEYLFPFGQVESIINNPDLLFRSFVLLFQRPWRNTIKR